MTMTSELRLNVILRDGYCVAEALDPMAGPCRDKWGELLPANPWPDQFEVDHVRAEPMMGKRAPDDMAHLVTLCSWHHQASGWATSHRPLLRDYLASLYPEEWRP